jgi:hypothetical protein
MTATALFIIAALFVVGGILSFRLIPVARAYFTYRGKRLITCPETNKTEAVDVAARKAAAGAFLGDPTLHLDRCSRWPERQDCGQECLQQIEADPDNCLVSNIISNWYEDKSCVLCHKPIGRLHAMDHTPALRGPDRKTIEWNHLRPEQLPEVLATYSPVCWNCHIATTFRLEHPELVVERHRSAN